MRWRPGPASPTGCCTARPSPSASAWRSGCPRRWASIGNNSVARVEAHFAGLGLPTRIADIPGGQAPDAATLLEIMGQDKKVRGGKLTLILVRGIGEAFITRDVAPRRVLDFLSRQIGR